MVRLSNSIWRQRKFIDSVRISVHGGRGGNGLPRYGGVGGKGGDVYVETCNSYTLRKLKLENPSQRFTAGRGEDSKRFRILGNPGQDIFIKSPPGISVITDSKQNLGDLNTVGEKLLIARGGIGGCPETNYIGQKGESLPLVLDLKLVADIGFVGFPNAGKSTLLKALSNAQPKIANYPFTTIEPNIGMLQYKDYRAISAADLPGLIEGAHLNFGMGHKFLKHCIRTKVLLFIVDIEGFRLNPRTSHRNAFEIIMFLNKELELYNEELPHKPAILAINKIDKDMDGTKFEELKDKLKCSEIYIEEIPQEMRPLNLIKFDAIIPISAKHGTNIPELKEKLRTIIDIYHEEKFYEDQKIRLSNLSKETDDIIYM